MARLIVKSPYYKCGGSSSVSGYLNYIATREHVEILPDDREPAQTDVYMKYIATRPRAERLGDHGLFGDEDYVDLNRAMAELDAYTGNVWTHIISLKREDATRLGYDNAAAWRNLLRTHRNDIAAAMKIPPDDFRWYAAFHDEGDHPHVHMMAWSVKPGQAFLDKAGIRAIKSELTNDIFRMEMLHLYEQKSETRDDLVRQSRKAMKELVTEMAEGICDHPDAERLMQELAEQLETVKGKKSYGYLPKQQKALVDKIVDQMERLPVVRECYDRWQELQNQVESHYHDTPQERIPLSQQKEFRQIKNAVIHEAERIRTGMISFEDRDMYQEDEPELFQKSSFDYWTLRDIIQNKELTMEERDDAVSELNRMAENGDMYAQYLMGKLWRDGPLLTPDWVNARYWFEQAALQGHLVAQYSIAKLYLSNDVEVRDTKKGMEWLQTAAENGSHYAMYRLAKEYLRGKCIEKDIVKAVDWFTRSAERGNQFAQYMLGKLYLTGKEFPCDKEKAVYWLTQSASHGNKYAQFFLDRQDSFRPPSVMLSVSRLLHHMSRIFEDNSLPQSNSNGVLVDKKLRQQIKEKKIAMGQKEDDHEEPRYGSWNMTM